MGNGNAQSGSCGAFGIISDHIKNLNVKLLSQGSEYGADEQGGKQAEGHGSQCIDQIGLDSDVNIFPF